MPLGRRRNVIVVTVVLIAAMVFIFRWHTDSTRLDTHALAETNTLIALHLDRTDGAWPSGWAELWATAEATWTGPRRSAPTRPMAASRSRAARSSPAARWAQASLSRDRVSARQVAVSRPAASASGVPHRRKRSRIRRRR